MAREIARRFNADIVQIKSEQYSLDYIGWLYANYDSRNNEESEIEPNVVDMKQYSHIFLGSPVWMFRPAPPLWTFVKSNTFNGKKVILFNTFNSRFKDDEL